MGEAHLLLVSKANYTYGDGGPLVLGVQRQGESMNRVQSPALGLGGTQSTSGAREGTDNLNMPTLPFYFLLLDTLPILGGSMTLDEAFLSRAEQVFTKQVGMRTGGFRHPLQWRKCFSPRGESGVGQGCHTTDA